MIKKKILIVAPYPITKPLHGGQKRAAALFDLYKENFFEAKFVAVFHRGQYEDWGKDDLPLGQPDIIAEVDKRPYASEVICGEAIDKDIHVRSYMAKLLVEYRPEIIHIEQPFAYLGLKVLLAELDMNPKIIFGSQNIEYPLKERIFNELKVEPGFAKALVAKVKNLEYELSQKADLLIAVNSKDAQTHKEMGAKRSVVAVNGIAKMDASQKEIKYWLDFKKTKKIEKIITFVGSGHPPNWEGFLKMVGSDLRFLPKDACIVIAGGVSDFFDNEFSDKKLHNAFWGHVHTTGKLEENRLAALISITDLIILPITTERGSNLKTAEAILSGKKFVATSNTFNGFEKYRRLPNIFIADSKAKFRDAIIQALESPFQSPTKAEKRLSETVEWKYCLAPILPALRKVLLIELLKKKKRSLGNKIFKK